MITDPPEDDATWHQIYDYFADEQLTGGIIMEQVHQDPADPNKVLDLHDFESFVAANGCVKFDELKSAMEGAGGATLPAMMVVSRAD